MFFLSNQIDAENELCYRGSTKILWRILNGIACIFFLFAAGVNCNDHDWYLWVPIYLSTSIFLAVEFFNYRSLSLMSFYLNAFVFCLVLAFGCHFLFKYQNESEEIFIRPHWLEEEEGRELSGLALATAWLFLILLNRLIEFNSRLSLVMIVCGFCLSFLPVGMWSVCFVSDDWRERFPQCQTMFTSSPATNHPTF